MKHPQTAPETAEGADTSGSRRSFLLAFFLVNLLLASYFLDTWNTPNPVSRALPVLTLVEQGTLRIDAYQKKVGDKSKVGEHYYSEKAPFPTLLMIPFYWPLHATGLIDVDEQTGKRFPIHVWKTVRGSDVDGRRYVFTELYPALLLGSFLGGSVPFAAMIWLALLAVEPLTTRVAPVVMVMLGFYGSFLFVFSGTFFGHILAGALLLGSYVSLKNERYLASGLLVGLAFLCDYPVGIALPIWLALLWYHERNAKRVAAFLAGASPSLLFIMLYNYAIGGNPFRMLNAYHAMGVFGKGLGRNYGFAPGNIGGESLWGLSFSFYMGLFVFVPILLVALIEVGRYALDARRKPLPVQGYVPVLGTAYFLLIASFFTWWGGWSFGPRYLIPPACLLVYEAVAFLARRPFSRVLFYGATLFGLFSAWLAKATLVYMIPDRTSQVRPAPAAGSNPVFDRLLPELLEGRFNNNSLPSMLLGVPPEVSVFVWPVLFAGCVWLLARLHTNLRGGDSPLPATLPVPVRTAGTSGPKKQKSNKRKRKKK